LGAWQKGMLIWEFVKCGIQNCGITEMRNNSSQLMQVFMAFHVMFLFIWLAMAMVYSDSSIVARAKVCRLLPQSRNKAKWLPRPSSDKFLITKNVGG